MDIRVWGYPLIARVLRGMYLDVDVHGLTHPNHRHMSRNLVLPCRVREISRSRLPQPPIWGGQRRKRGRLKCIVNLPIRDTPAREACRRTERAGRLCLKWERHRWDSDPGRE
jgi:hypothetical protein